MTIRRTLAVFATPLLLLGTAAAQINCPTPKGMPKACLDGKVYSMVNLTTKAERKVQNVQAPGGRWGLADENGNVIVKPTWVHLWPISDRAAVVEDEKGVWKILEVGTEKIIPVDGHLSLDGTSSGPTQLLWRWTPLVDGVRTVEYLDDRGAVVTTLTDVLSGSTYYMGHTILNRRTANGHESVLIDDTGRVTGHGQPYTMLAAKYSVPVVITGRAPEGFDPRVTRMFLPIGADGQPQSAPGVIGVYPIFDEAPDEGSGYSVIGWVIVREAPGGKVTQTVKVQEELKTAITSTAQAVEVQSVSWQTYQDANLQVTLPLLHLANGKWGWYARNKGVYSDGVVAMEEALNNAARERLGRGDALANAMAVRNPTPGNIKYMAELAASDYSTASRYASRYRITIDDGLVVSRICSSYYYTDKDLCKRVNDEYYASSRANDLRVAQRNQESEAWLRTMRENHREPMPDLSYIHENAVRNGAYGPSGGGSSTADRTHQLSEVEIRKQQQDEACYGNVLRCK